MIKIVSDSSCDRPELSGVEYVPMVMSTDECSFTDDGNLDVHEMLDYMSAYKGRSYTACPSVDGWLQAFEGGDEIYALTITSGLSGSYNSATAAAGLFQTSHPEAKIHVFDSLSTGAEMQLVLEKLQELTDAGLPFEEVVEKTREYQKHTRLFFILQSVHNLAQNGRVSKVVAAAVGVLNIRIVGTASTVGTLEQLAKSRGDNKALKEMMAQITAAGYHGGKMCIHHAENPELAQRLADAVKEQWPEAAIAIGATSGLCSYYAERYNVMVGLEAEKVYE